MPRLFKVFIFHLLLFQYSNQNIMKQFINFLVQLIRIQIWGTVHHPIFVDVNVNRLCIFIHSFFFLFNTVYYNLFNLDFIINFFIFNIIVLLITLINFNLFLFLFHFNFITFYDFHVNVLLFTFVHEWGLHFFRFNIGLLNFSFGDWNWIVNGWCRDCRIT